MRGRALSRATLACCAVLGAVVAVVAGPRCTRRRPDRDHDSRGLLVGSRELPAAPSLTISETKGESNDIKEGSTGGILRGNTLDGATMAGWHSAPDGRATEDHLRGAIVALAAPSEQLVSPG